MRPNLFKYLNLTLVAFCLLLAVGAVFLWLNRPQEITEVELVDKKVPLPKSAFSQSEEAYANIGEPVLSLHFQPPSLRLPDLRNLLIYYGKNGRPDANQGDPLLHFAFLGTKCQAGLKPKEKLYLTYDKKKEGCRFAFSPSNVETPLWLEASLENTDALVELHALNELGTEVVEPEAHKNFTLPEKEFVRVSGNNWELGKWKVDATILARQRAKWLGPDRFLEEHGGDEYKDVLGKQRIDFGEGDETYSIFVKLGETMIYDKDRWRVIKPGDESLIYPLLVVKKIDERIMNLELWDVQGKAKVSLNLLKSSENLGMQNMEQTFKFLGARTRSQFVFEVDNERMLIRPHDWLVLTDEGWKKLTTVEEIDDFVNRKLVGTLFVFDEIMKKDEKQVMKGTVYNANRTESVPVELAMQSTVIMNSPKKGDVGPEKPEKVLEETASRESAYKNLMDNPSYAKQK